MENRGAADRVTTGPLSPYAAPSSDDGCAREGGQGRVRARVARCSRAITLAASVCCAIGCGAAARNTDGNARPNAAAAVSGAPGRLTARPARPTGIAEPGLHPLALGDDRDGFYYVPAGYRPDHPAPLVLLLHGAGRRAREGLGWMQPLADSAGLVLLAPDSRDRTWDFVLGPYGPDVAFIDRALAEVFRRVAIDPRRVAIAGFSDGASYALSLGITNADIFSRIVAFSACIVAPAAETGRPRVFLSHGTADRILPIDRCGRRLHDRLVNAGFDVEYHEFDGPHMVPPDVAAAAVAWLARP